MSDDLSAWFKDCNLNSCFLWGFKVPLGWSSAKGCYATGSVGAIRVLGHRILKLEISANLIKLLIQIHLRESLEIMGKGRAKRSCQNFNNKGN